MKKRLSKLLIGGLAFTSIATSCATTSIAQNNTQTATPVNTRINVRGPIGTYLQTLPKEPLSRQERRDLIHMREEEKLARDVYLTLSEMWNMPVFTNISRAEQQHMNMVGFLLEKYNIKDPVEKTGNIRGKFKKREFERLYKKLVKKGSKSLIDALEVGAIIEDLDIKDLQDTLERTDNQDIKVVYENLIKGSRNHMRAFTRILRRYGVEYKPQYISDNYYKEIINSKHEIGMIYGSNGQPTLSQGTIKLTGKVKRVFTRQGFGNKRVTWWVAEIKTVNGKREKVALAPTWLYGSINIKPGDKVTVTGYVPPFWRTNNIKGIMACTVNNLSENVRYNFRNCTGANRGFRRFKFQNR